MKRTRHSVDYSSHPSAPACPSPLLSDRFANSVRQGTRPSTCSSFSFLGSDRSPRFYEKVFRWFRKNRGRHLNGNGCEGGVSGNGFPTEKHSSVHHRALIGQGALPVSRVGRGSSLNCPSPLLGTKTSAAKSSNSPFSRAFSSPRRRSQGGSSSLAMSAEASRAAYTAPGGGGGSGFGFSSVQRTSIPENASPLAAASCTPPLLPIGGNSDYIGPSRAPLATRTSTSSSGSGGIVNSSNNIFLSSAGASSTSAHRDMSIESGYHSFSSCSSPVAPARQGGTGSTSSLVSRSRPPSSRVRFLSRALQAVRVKGQSLSEEFRENPLEVGSVGGGWQSRSTEDNAADPLAVVGSSQAAAVGAENRRRLYQTRVGAFNTAVHDDDDEPRCESRGSSSVGGEGGGLNSVYGSSVFTGSLSSLSTADAHEMVALTLGDFRFRYGELELGQLVAAARSGHTIRRGKCQVWDVVIHSCCPNNDDEVRDWLADVRRLTQIRHENIVLYMGACVEPPQFAIITSLIKADSLQAHTEVPGSRLAASAKLSVLRQTANAFSYLHCRGILHGRLSAHNIFLESTVKVSLLDYAPDRLNLQYYAPEIARELRAEAAHLPLNKSQAGDVFAFGTLVYLLACSRLPFAGGLAAEVLLYQVGQGGLAAASLPANIHPGLGRLIGRCWDPEPASRPTFPAICNQLQSLVNSFSTTRKHSSSEPRNLDQLGKIGTGLLAVN